MTAHPTQIALTAHHAQIGVAEWSATPSRCQRQKEKSQKG